MILKDFETGGFPITRRSPIICFFSGDIIEIAYNHYSLKKIIEKHKGYISCVGVWPGKKNTDCFIINPENYCRYIPPEIHADIDSAEEISVLLNKNGIFKSIQYIPGSFSEDKTPIISKDKSLFEYIKYAQLRCKQVFHD